MLTESTKEMTLSKEEVSAAIEAIKSKGWDINPYTVADEINVARSVIYRNVQFMRLIIEARGGTFGLDVETSLNLAHRIQDLEQSKAELEETIRELQRQIEAEGIEPVSAKNFQAVEDVEIAEQIEPVVPVLPPEEAGAAGNQESGSGNISDTVPAGPIYNAAALGNFPGFGAVTLSSIHWKELEKLMNLQVDTLDNLAVAPQDELKPEIQPSHWDRQQESEDLAGREAKAKRRPRKRTSEITGDFDVPEGEGSLSKPTSEDETQLFIPPGEPHEPTAEAKPSEFREEKPAEFDAKPEQAARSNQVEESENRFGEETFNQSGAPTFAPDPIDQIDLDEIDPQLDERQSFEAEEMPRQGQVLEEDSASPVEELVAPVELEPIEDTSWIEEEELALHEEAIALTAERHEQVVGPSDDDYRYQARSEPQQPPPLPPPPPRVIATPPPVITTPPPVITTPPPVITTPPPVITTPPPVITTPPPVITTPPPAMETPPPAMETPPEVVETPPEVVAQENTTEAETFSDRSLAGPHYAFDQMSYSPPVIVDRELDLEEESFIEMDSEVQNGSVLDVPIPPSQPRAPEKRDRTVITDDYPKVDPNAVFDLDNADIFEDMDGETLINLDVIEDVVPPDERLTLPPQPAPEITELIDDPEALEVLEEALDALTPRDTEAFETNEAASEVDADGNTVSGEELRQLIKNRIEQAAADQQKEEQALAAKEREKEKEALKGPGRSKFVGTKAAEPAQPNAFVTRVIPPDIRKACLILGVRPEEMTHAIVTSSWKQQIAAPGVHPDLGGDTESAIYLNTAKDTLVRWLDQQAPKLGKKFGQPTKDTNKTEPPENKKHSK